MSNRPDATWTPLDAAAAVLGISPDAARKRLERGTLAGEKRDGRWFVRVDAPDAMSGQSTGQPDAISDTARELVDQLKSENAFLREQLDQRSRELAAERERADILHREALGQIQALTTGDDDYDVDQDETATMPYSASPEAPGREEAPVMTSGTPHEPSIVAGWLRRLFGRS